MSIIPSYPHLIQNVEDRTIYVPSDTVVLPIHRALFVMKAQQGVVGDPIWCEDYEAAKTEFGAETFNVKNTKYFSPAAYFAKETLSRNGCYICRVCDDGDAGTAATGFLILEAQVEEVDVPQYAREVDGSLTLDVDGEPTQLLGEDAVAPGVKITWKIRTALLGEETVDDLDSLAVRAVEGGGANDKIYPMQVYKYLTPGAVSNDHAIQLYYDSAQNDANMVQRVGSVLYTFAPRKKEYGATTTDPVYTANKTTSVSYSAKPNAYDPSTGAELAIAEVLKAQYADDAVLPYEVYNYSDNFNAIGKQFWGFENTKLDSSGATATLIDDVKDVTADSEDGFLANIISGVNTYDIPYYCMQIVDDSDDDDATDPGVTSMKQDINHYLANGADGSLTDTAIEERVRDFFNFDINPDVSWSARYPFTHIYDVGYHLETAKTMINFINTRKDVKAYLGTQQVSDAAVGAYTAKNTPNTQYEDESRGSVLATLALLQQESYLKGTAACRVTILQHCGIPYGEYNGYLPMTLWIALKNAEYGNRTYMGEEPKGLPNASVDIFEKVNWTATQEYTQQHSWENGLNYIQYYKPKLLHFASLRSVYPYDTSVLVDDSFTNALVYAKHTVRDVWAKYVGRTTPFGILKNQVEGDLIRELSHIFNGKYTVEVTMYQTAEDAKLGYVYHVQINITAPATTRVWNVDIVCNRENYNTVG